MSRAQRVATIAMMAPFLAVLGVLAVLGAVVVALGAALGASDPTEGVL